MTGQPHRSAPAAMAIGGAATVVVVLPAFLTGALAVQLTGELAFGAAGLGAAVAVNRASSAATSIPLGRLADRLGATWSLRIAVVVVAVASVGIAMAARGWWSLAGWLALAGAANALGQPAANRMLVNVVPPERLGLGFGVKQSAPPTATMIAGLSAPVIALTLGWRWAFVLGAVLALIVLAAVGRRAPAAHRPPVIQGRRAKLEDRAMIVLFAVAFGLGVAASSSVTTFYVDAAVRAGSSQSLAGVLLAVASGTAVVSRVGFGIVCDRLRSGHLKFYAGGLTASSVGFALLAVGRPAPMAVGVIVAIAGSWGFNAVFWYALVRAYRDTPGAITGALAPGGLIGGVVGPVVFGFLVVGASYSAAWVFAGAMALLGAGAMLLGERRLASVRPDDI